MALATAEVAIAQHFATSWGAIRPTVPIVWPNEKRPSPPPDSWVRFQVQTVRATHPDLGDTRIRDLAQVVVEVCVRGGTGDGLLRALRDDVRRIFTGLVVGGAVFSDTGFDAPRVLGATSDDGAGAHYRSIVIAPFRFEHTA